jgi:transposase
MRQGKLVFAQLSEHLPRSVFLSFAARFSGRYPTLSFSHWDQFLCMMFAQLTARSSLRDIVTCLHGQRSKLYHAGFRGNIARSTLADANEKRNYQIFEEFALHLISIARPLYASQSLGSDLAQTVYAIDSTTIDLCLSLFEWAPATKGRAGIKLHTQLDLRGNIPTFILITESRVSDVSFLDDLPLEAGSFYVMDRGYVHFARLLRFTHAGAFFVTRAKNKMRYQVASALAPLDDAAVLKDECILLTGQFTHKTYPHVLRRIEFFDQTQQREFVFVTNNFELDATQIAALYKSRWQVELFFKWIKQHLRIKSFVGNSVNAVKTQIWIAVSTYVLVAIIKKRLQIEASLHSMLQVLSLTLFETTSLIDLLKDIEPDPSEPENLQMGLFEEISGH